MGTVTEIHAEKRKPRMNKIYKTYSEAVADIPDSASIMIGGFGHAADKPQNLIKALRDHGAKNLTLIGNSSGNAGKLGIGSLGGIPFIDEEILVENRQVRKAICSVPASLVMSKPSAFEKQYLAHEVELEYVPQEPWPRGFAREAPDWERSIRLRASAPSSRTERKRGSSTAARCCWNMRCAPTTR